MNEVFGIILIIVFGMFLAKLARMIGSKIGFSELVAFRAKDSKRNKKKL
jgi:hypothetical protein